ALPRAGVADGEPRNEAVALERDGQALVHEGRVRQAVAEREQRRLPLAGVPAVAEVRALDVVVDVERLPRSADSGEVGLHTVEPVELRTRQLRFGPRESDRQPPGGVDLAAPHLG